MKKPLTACGFYRWFVFQRYRRIRLYSYIFSEMMDLKIFDLLLHSSYIHELRNYILQKLAVYSNSYDLPIHRWDVLFMFLQSHSMRIGHTTKVKDTGNGFL